MIIDNSSRKENIKKKEKEKTRMIKLAIESRMIKSIIGVEIGIRVSMESFYLIFMILIVIELIMPKTTSKT